MARKFNMGRQGEQLLNEEFHKLFMALKYLNYDRYSDVEDLKKERQTEIPNHALRLKTRDDLNYMEMYRKLDEDTMETTIYYGYPNTVEVYDDKTAVWNTLFDGYFHPASAVKPEKDNEKNIAPYQLCIDPKTGAIMYWDATTNNWTIASALQYLGDAATTFSGVNFQLINNLKSVSAGSSTYYPVPYVPFGKLFSDKMAVPFSRDEERNDCAIVTNKDNLSWVHVNALKLKKVDKRLIKVRPDATSDVGFINITSSQTEFYGFKMSGGQIDIFGELLIRDEDFTDVIGGIQLTSSALQTYKYIYAITYTFDDYPTSEGRVIQHHKKIGGANQVYIGDTIADDVALFIDGLALEQRGVYEDRVGEYDIYQHDKIEGTITFMDNDDANIINQMQMSVLIFPRRTHEFVVSASHDLDYDDSVVRIDLGTTLSEGEYVMPMVFCSGLGLQSTTIQQDVVIEGNFLTINNFTLQQDEEGNDLEMYKCFVADVGDSYICEGILDGYRIKHGTIQAGNQYVVFVNGILMTPTNKDIEVGNGYIDLVNAEDAQYDELHYIVFEISDYDDNKIGLVYDDDVSYYSIRIEDKDATVYDDCNCAIVYVGSDSEGEAGILLDEAAVEKPLNPAESFYKGNQIVRTTDFYGHHKYYLYDFTSDAPTEITNSDEIREIEQMITYYANSGSIQLVGDNERLEGYDLRYLAYSFVNMIDEPLMVGYQDNLPIMVKGRDFEELYTGSAARKHGWKLGHNSLSTYINGLITANDELIIDQNTGEEIDAVTGVARHFTVKRPILDMKPTDYYGDKDLILTLEIIYALYKDKTELEIRTVDADDVMSWTVGDGTVGDYFSSINLFIDAWKLAKYIEEDMNNEHISYVVENIERNEFMAAHRDFIFLETGDKTTDHKQIYKLASDTIETDFILAPGTVNVYVNGVLLEDSDYCKFDSNKIMFNVDVCGLQQLPNNKEACLSEKLSEKDIEDIKHLYKYEPKKIVRIIEDKPYYIPTSNRDEILIEKRDDTSIKHITFELKPSSYESSGTIKLSQDFYDIPESLMTTADHVKIYINGVYYDEGYVIEKISGLNTIKLTKPGTLFIDPVYEYIYNIGNQVQRLEYEKKYGIYQRKIDKITFEWR